MKRIASFALTLFTLLPHGLNAQAPVTYDRLANAPREPQNYLIYGGDYFSNRFSPLTQITTENVNVRHFLNLTWVSRPVAPRRVVPKEIFGALWAKYGNE